MIFPPSPRAPYRPGRRRRVLAWLMAGITAGLIAAEGVRRSFNIPAAMAEQSLRQFSTQSGVQLIYPTALVRDIQTNAVKGQFTDREALDRLLARTPLRVVRDEKTRALTITRQPDPGTDVGRRNPPR